MPRQPNRRPSIYPGKDGWYHCYVTVGQKPNGQLDRRHLRGKTASEVVEKLKALDDRVRRGAGAAPGKIQTVEQWMLHWLDNVVKPNRSYKTWRGYQSLIVQHVIPGIGQWRLDGTRNLLEPEHVEAMYAQSRKTLASTSVLKIHRVLRRALKDAVRRGKASRNVCDLIDPPDARPAKVKAHRLEEAQAIIRAAADDDMAPRWLIGLLLGLRQGEVLGLRWHRVELDGNPPTLEVAPKGNLQRRTWEHGCDNPVECAAPHCRTKPCPPKYEHGCWGGAETGGSTDPTPGDPPPCARTLAHHCPSRRQVPGCSRHTRPCPPPCTPGCTKHASRCPQRTGGGLVDGDPKSEKGERELIMDSVLVDFLRAWRERQIRDRAILGKDWNSQGYVFTTFEGAPVDPRRDWTAWKQLLVRAGVKDSRLHAARHTAGTLMLATGTDISVVQEILGHVDIRTTRGYVEVAKQLKQEAVDRVAKALFDGQLAALLQPAAAPNRPPA